MKATFIVTIEGKWNYNGQSVTAAIVEREVRKAVRDEFEDLADRVAVRRVKNDKVPTQAPAIQDAQDKEGM